MCEDIPLSAELTTKTSEQQSQAPAVARPASPRDVELNRELEAELARAVAGEVLFDPYARVLYSTDASSYQIEPVGVVIPRIGDDVHAVIEIAGRYGVPLLPRGGGSSLAGQAVGAAIVIDFSKHLNHIIEVSADEHWVRAEPGLVCDRLNAGLRPHGLMYGPDPASSNRATVGGMLANNATGAHSILYGMAADHVLAVEVLLSDGTAARLGPLGPSELDARMHQPGRLGDLYRGLTAIVDKNATAIRDRFPRTWRRASGYGLNYLVGRHGYTATQPPGWYSDLSYPPAAGFNVAKLLAGSEGTLAVVSEATLSVVPRPACTGLCVLPFDSIAGAADATAIVLDCQPAAVELIDALLINLTRSVPAFARLLTFVDTDQSGTQTTPAAMLVVEFFGDTEMQVKAQIEKLELHLARRGARLSGRTVRALSAAQQANVWGVRKVGLGLLMSMRGPAKPTPFMEDVAVPVERLGEYVRAIQRLFAEQGVDAAFYAHASAGCLHIRPILNLKRADDIERMRALAAAVVELVVALGGAMSGEHGDGLSRSAFNGRLFGPEIYSAFCEVKQLFDPAGLLNPGKVVNGPDLAANLRLGPNYRPFEIKTNLSFARDGGFAAAIEQCNGAGVCRKMDGSMCPSFMATRDEEHSTRGRANALRAAISGPLPPKALTSKRMHDVLDLCLECKACKAECPSGVDMAKLKYEFLDRYNRAHGVPLRARFFAYLHGVLRLAHPFSGLANLALGLGPVRWLNSKVLGLAQERALPKLAGRTFRHQFQGLAQSVPAGTVGREVVLLVDTFTEFNEPAIGMAAVIVLNAAGYHVQVIQHGCCGRPMISKGLLTQARKKASALVEALGPFAERRMPILGLEPSCLLTLRDEYLDLLPDSEAAARVAEHALLVEEFVAGLADRGSPPFRWRQRDGGRVLVHPHCYQKALPGTRALLAMLRLPGWEVRESDAGCCGMAGSFGYEAEHYELSKAIGEGRLFPTVRETDSDVMLAVSGMSCRHQIAHGTGRKARHPIELLADALE